MHIVMFSINPLFPDRVTGGAPRQLQRVAEHLAGAGQRVTVLCTQAPGADQPFTWGEGVQVLPLLPFKQPFPQPYDIPAYTSAAVLQIMGEYLATADRFYMHDGEFLFPYAYQQIPTVVSLRDNLYPETIHGGYLFAGDKLILISEYSRRYYLDTVGRFFPEFGERVVVINNGIEFEQMRPTPPSPELLRLLPTSIDLARHALILHPHRPEASKGAYQTLAVIDTLVHDYGLTHIRLLMPRWLNTQLTPALQAFYDDLQAEIDRRGLHDYVAWHGWLPLHLLPEFYTLGALTLSLGSFPESFGNAVYESLACGTPSLAARVATHRELLPDMLLAKVDYDDTAAAAAYAAAVISEERRTSPETLAYLREHYAATRQVEAYADVILNAQVAAPMRYQHPTLNENARFGLAYWCYRAADGRVYHDFR
ncbi:MAG: glycosyltransferase family 4 protein, partial [Armatimonadetes bacterium]|nr:glycosyltransferase family 4 protein [Anaerolineae bacterium]